MVKFCTDCKHHRIAAGAHVCAAFDYTAMSPIDGASRAVEPRPPCADQRSLLAGLAPLLGYRGCGPEGNLFEPRKAA